MAGRLFNEKEVREILKKASESRLHEDLPEADGISLEELRQIGSELGFDPRSIELAAQTLGNDTPSRTGFLGGRTALNRVVEGEISADDWLGMVAVVQRHHKGSGAITQWGSNYDWAGSEKGGSLALTVNVRKGRSRIRLESNQWLEIFMVSVFCPIFALVTMSLMSVVAVLAALPVCLFFGGLLFFLIRLFRQYHLHSVSGLMERLVDEVLSESAAQPLERSAFTLSEAAPSEQPIRS